MSLLNSSEFNTNPECAGYGPSEVASEPFKTVQLALAIVGAIFAIISALITLVMRRYRRRLRIRSILPIFMGSFCGYAIILTRASFDYVGRQYMPCSLEVALFYLVIPLSVISESTAGGVFLAKQYQRQQLNATALQALEKRINEKGSKQERRMATPAEFFEGWWDFTLSMFALMLPFVVDQKHFYHPVRRPSIYRETAYEFISMVIISVPFIIAVSVRIAMTTHYQPGTGCTGCIVAWEDILIVGILMLAYLMFAIALMYKVSSFNIPDPLWFVTDMKRGIVVTTPLFIVSLALLATDPGNVMKEQRMDWHYINMLMIWVLHVQRTTFQSLRTRRVQKKAEKNINLIDILSDSSASLLFEKHLIGELANENLLFWREGIKYKNSFDRNADFDYSQQMAKVLWRTFLAPHASLPINISDTVKRTIDARFKGIVGKAVFDEALAEVYLMMQNGAFQRFLHSSAFKEYLNTKADFSMSTVVAPMSIVPSVEDGVSQGINIDIKDYIKSI